MIGEVAAVAEVAGEAAKEAAKETAKEIGKAASEKAVDVTKRVDISKPMAEASKSKVDINKRISPEALSEVKPTDIGDTVKDYLNDLKTKSVCPDTLASRTLDISKLELKSPEQVAELREEFVDARSKLRQEWETLNNREWPRYKEDVVNENGTTLRKAGDRYDAHHIQPLQLGGANEASNITPMDITKHCEIHSKGGSCTRMVEKVSEVGKL